MKKTLIIIIAVVALLLLVASIFYRFALPPEKDTFLYKKITNWCETRSKSSFSGEPDDQGNPGVIKSVDGEMYLQCLSKFRLDQQDL